MTKEQISTYTMRISQANTSALAVVLYDIILECIKEGGQHYENGETVDFEVSMQQAQEFLHKLMSMSKLDTQTGCDVMSLYLFIDKQLLLSYVRRKPENLPQCIGLLERLRSAFAEISKRDYDPPLMEHVQQVYAGLTYGKGYLKESRDPMQEQNRGLQA
ncbi:MAG: flagellar protein FliS [Bacteroides sp.]|nr:flagellar protein FliS [Bacteroides sp.]MCM1549062.1 flagellar protein FliS [Clostridium sp.]